MITGAPPNVSDALLINGQPGDLLPCSSQGEHRLICIAKVVKQELRAGYILEVFYFYLKKQQSPSNE
jgi:hypothetical protein